MAEGTGLAGLTGALPEEFAWDVGRVYDGFWVSAQLERTFDLRFASHSVCLEGFAARPTSVPALWGS
jgi:hypothetical protein